MAAEKLYLIPIFDLFKIFSHCKIIYSTILALIIIPLP